jgi:hypothetical protein
MKLTEWLMWGVVGWTAIGVLGVIVSQRRGERQRMRTGIGWLTGVWVVYLCVLLGVSLTQKQKVVAMGEPQCFGDMCFAVTRVEEVPGFLIRDGRRLLRVSVQVTNHGASAQSERGIQAYLVDHQARRWDESVGVSGVRLDARLGAGDAVLSEPVFKIAGDATGLRLVFTRGRRMPWALVIGDSDSVLHRRTVVDLER